MVIKGNARAGAKSLAAHLLRADTNEQVTVAEIRGVVAEDLLGALKEIEAVSVCTNTTKPFYHASINVPIEEKLTPEQRMKAIDRLEKELGLTDQPRAIVIHEKYGREHCHIVWSRTDLEHSRAIRMDHNYRKHEIVARELEREFGHARVQGAHVERDGQERPARTPGHDEMQQAGRTKLTPQKAKEQITALWRSTDGGRAFQAAIEEKGWLLARGDRRDFVVVDPRGGTHSLARRVEGAKAHDIRSRMQDIDVTQLPTVADARARQLERLATLMPQMEEDEERRRATPVVDGLEWTDRAGMVAQQRSAMNWVKASDSAPRPVSRPGEKVLRFADDPDQKPKPGGKEPRVVSPRRLNFFEDRNPDKDIDRDR
jgi:hypothetical protein